ncbi:galactose mutarotase-like enzyme [Bradyrhizobium japonicum]
MKFGFARLILGRAKSFLMRYDQVAAFGLVAAMEIVMTDDTHTIRSGGLTATIKAHGAELCSLKDGGGVEFVWQAEPAWPRHAPLLFPIVGRLANDEMRHRGKTYRMTQHGFARDSRFAWVERGENRCTLALEDSEATRALYPFAFRLTATYAIDAAGLDLSLTVANTGKETLPVSLGGHPAFNWPLQPGMSKESYALTFTNEEPSPVRRVEGGLLLAATDPSPVRGTVLPLSESLFTNDAVILDPVNSHAVRYAAGQGGRALAQNVMARFSRARRLVETDRRAVPVHRALARLCQSRRFRWRVQRQAGADAHRTRRERRTVVPDRGRVVLRRLTRRRCGRSAKRLVR